jgi:hypothetical protein
VSPNLLWIRPGGQRCRDRVLRVEPQIWPPALWPGSSAQPSVAYETPRQTAARATWPCAPVWAQKPAGSCGAGAGR